MVGWKSYLIQNIISMSRDFVSLETIMMVSFLSHNATRLKALRCVIERGPELDVKDEKML